MSATPCNYFAGSELDRAPDRRRDRSWVEEQWRSRHMRLLALWAGRALVDGGEPPALRLLTRRDGLSAVPDVLPEEAVLLGLDRDGPIFALDLSDTETSGGEPPLSTAVGDFMTLRQVGARLRQREGAWFAYGRGVLAWMNRARYCGTCGTPTRAGQGGHVMTCTADSCRLEHFPRVDPAIIVLVHDGDRCLLGRQASWPAGRFSTLAGFVEPGESAEDAVRREVREETGVEVDAVRYASSQPWPFPHSLMLGFRARARTTEVRIDPDELEDARWFSREELAADESRADLPGSEVSISRRLVLDWLSEPSGG